MFILNSTRINIYAPYTTGDGIRYADLTNPEVRTALGVEEIAEPTPPGDYSEETYYRTEQDDAPYVVYTKKSNEQLEQLRKSKVLAQIDALEATITPRRMREALLTGDHTFIDGVDQQIAALRSQL